MPRRGTVVIADIQRVAHAPANAARKPSLPVSRT